MVGKQERSGVKPSGCRFAATDCEGASSNEKNCESTHRRGNLGKRVRLGEWMNSIRSNWYAEAMPCLLEKRELSAGTMAAAMMALTSGQFDDGEAASFLSELRAKGETANEIVVAVRVLRERMISLARSAPALDTCGTGGDGSGTFNVSTAVALVAAAAGCSVVKHGNRAVSSRSGSADVLSELGIPVERGPAWAQSCLDRFGFAFCFRCGKNLAGARSSICSDRF
jgi:hypothetical protein